MSQLSIRAALELALRSIPDIIQAADIVSSNGAPTSVFTTSLPHNLISGMNVRIADHSSGVGSYVVIVLSPTTFSLKDTASGVPIRFAAGTGGTATAQLTAWENVGFVPLNGTPYQKVNFLFGTPYEPEAVGATMFREVGFMQVTLYYPLQTGPFAALSRAELIRKTFPRGSSFIYNGITTRITKTAEIAQGMTTDESYIVIVRVSFNADIFQ